MTRSVCVLIAAMGGEGGGVLADWLIDAATQKGLPVQSTSVPGVAQRTGATTYYVEIYPVPRTELGGREPVLSLTPTPGGLDLVAASELVEAGRAIQTGYVGRLRTVLCASTHREFAVSEKSAMSDGRYDSTRVLQAAHAMAKQSVLFDMRVLAQRNGTVINTVLFGAMARSGQLPFDRAACEDAIRRSGKAVEASLRGFAAGYEWTPGADAPVLAKDPGQMPTSARLEALPEAIRSVVAAGVAHTADFQDARYAKLYLDRVEHVLKLERAAGDPQFPVTRETSRYLALWMAFEDVIRVADLKSRRERIDHVRQEVGAKAGEPVQMTEFLKPGLDEICSVLPPRLSAWARRRLAPRAHALQKGIHLRSHTVLGFMTLVALRSLRPLRRRMSRFLAEQELIERWLCVVRDTLARDPELAHEIALAGNLVKGYGETSERGHRNLMAILEDVERTMATQSTDFATVGRVRKARKAALEDPEGRALASALGLPPPQPVAQPIRFVRRRPAG
ncbi:indolepyruvate oxidoreductase subunit B [Xenophilus aerolatus]|nr:indolepyruvate oxidoreductase subunit B [Xenophilus aerolatus]